MIFFSTLRAICNTALLIKYGIHLLKTVWQYTEPFKLGLYQSELLSNKHCKQLHHVPGNRLHTVSNSNDHIEAAWSDNSEIETWLVKATKVHAYKLLTKQHCIKTLFQIPAQQLGSKLNDTEKTK